MTFETENVILGETLAEIANINTGKMDHLYVQVKVATNALDQFEILTKCEGGAYVQWFTDAADYTSPQLPLHGTSGDLTIIPAGQTGWFLLDVRAVDRVQLKAASGNAAGSTTSVSAGGS